MCPAVAVNRSNGAGLSVTGCRVSIQYGALAFVGATQRRPTKCPIVPKRHFR
jgi:hypothetical protein